MRCLPFRALGDVAPAVEAAREVLSNHGVILFPTETFYGLGADPRDPQAVERVFALKQREQTKALLVVAADLQQVEGLALVSEPWRQRLAHLWPAPLTVVLAARQPLPGSGATVAVRVPAHPLLRQLLAQVGPLTATSANLSGQPPACQLAEVKELAQAVDLVLDGGRTPGGLPSTLVDLTTSPPRLLRPGALVVPPGWLQEA
jgi:L-threonylcarbamoyladenylate synthase